MSDSIGNVWIFIEQEAGKIADVSLELVCKGRELADKLGVKTEAVLLGDKVESCCDTLFAYGCDTVYLAEDPRLEPFTVLPFAMVECPDGHFIEVADCSSGNAMLMVHGSGETDIVIYRSDRMEKIHLDDNGTVVRELEISK